MRLWTFFTNVLADLKLAQPRNQPGAEEQADEQGGDARVGRAKRNVLENVEYPQRRPVPVQRIKKFVKNVIQHRCYGSRLEKAARNVLSACSSFTPRDPLMRTTSPFFRVRAKRSPV